ncbi:MFS transporter [Sphingomonas mali]|uniref:MFS transporter n=1 Tax=Sphingomonas mali TaxID=40682 RepID=UPI000837244C|nr:MFS transporter [Sphingomonas mali]
MTMATAAPAIEADTAQPSPDHVLKGGWFTLWFALAVTLFAFVDRQVLTLAAAPMSASLGLSDSQLGMIQGLAFAIFSVAAVYPIAWAADRFGRRSILALCILTWSLGTAACGVAQNFEQLFIAAIAVAAGEAGAGPIFASFVPELFKGRKRLLANGLMYFFAYLGISAGLALGGGAIGMLDAVHSDLPAAVRAFESWRLAFFLVVLPAPLFLIFLTFARLDTAQSASATATGEGRGAEEFWSFIWQNRSAIGPVFGGLTLYMVAFGGYLVWLPVAATRLFGATPAQNGTAMGLATAVGMVGGVATGTLIVRRLIVCLGPVATIRFFWIAMLLSTPLLLAFPFVGATWQVYALFGALMLTGTAIGCMVPTLLQDMAPAVLRARLFAVWAIVAGLVGGSAPTLVGWVSSALGAEPRQLLVAMTIVAVPAWAAGIVLLRLAERPFAGLIHHVAERERVTI